mmetsp:Transcript_14479/g.21343  ORF Transcript_14479/g.21343 Transcript_14479/m.21343 type:complete len:356 (-) Transcript_14479:33-1100(-)
MMWTITILYSLLSLSSAAPRFGNQNPLFENRFRSRPQISLTLRDGTYTDLIEGLDPVVVWEDEIASSGDGGENDGFTLTGGVQSTFRRMPERIWGNFRTRVSNRMDANLRAEYTGDGTTQANLEFGNIDNTIVFRLDTTWSWQPLVRRFELTKRFYVQEGEGQMSITPRVVAANVGDSGFYRDVVLEYGTVRRNANGGRTNLKLVIASKFDKELEINHSTRNTAVQIMASRNSQEVTASQQLDDDNRVIANMNSMGHLNLAWEHQFSKRGLLMTSKGTTTNRRRSDFGEDEEKYASTVKATLQTIDDTILVEYEDGPWSCNVQAPLSLFDTNDQRGATFRIQRKIDLSLLEDIFY